MAVTNDNIRPPIIIQNRRNKHTFDTYAYTIDLVPLVLEETCLIGPHLNTSGKPSKRRNSKGVKQKCAKEMNEEAHLHAKTGMGTIEEATQA